MDSSDFLIRLIVQANNQVSGVFQKAAAEVDKLTASQKRNADQVDKTSAANRKIAKDVDDLRARYAAFTADVAKNGKEVDDATAHLKKFSSEFQALARTQKAGTPLFEDLTRAARAADDLSKSITAARKKQQAEVEAAYKQAQQMDEAYSKLTKDRVDREQRATAARKGFLMDLLGAVKETDDSATNITDDGAKKRLQATERELEARAKATKQANADYKKEMSAFFSDLAATERKFQDDQIKEDARLESVRSSSNLPATRAVTRNSLSRTASTNNARPFSSDAAEIGKLSTATRKLADDQERATRTTGGFLGALQGLFGADPEKIDRINKAVEDVESSLGRGSFTAIRFAGTLRSLVYVGVFVFFQELTGAAIALGGALVSVASAAVQAGAALAGAATAGAAQAIPVVGLLAAAWGRVGAVFKAVQQQQKTQVQAGYDAAQSADRQRSAADAIRSAQEGLSSAQRQGTNDQLALNKAREDAVRTIEDLVAAEKKAQEQAESAALAQQDAASALATSFRTGDVGSLAKNALDLRSANLDLSDANVAQARASVDASKAVAGGVEGDPGVVAARQAVSNDARSIADANRQLKEAQASAKEATHDIDTADRNLQQMLALLSPAERKLYDALVQLEDKFKEVFSGGKGKDGVLAPIIDAFTEGADRLLALLRDNRLINAARDLATTIGDELKKAFDFLTGRANVSFIEDMAKQAQQNLPGVVSIFEHLFDIVKSIAVAGGPALKAFIKFFEDLASKGAAATGSESGISRLEKFFDKGEQYAESIGRLAGAIAQLFAAIIGTAAQQGQNAIDSITSAVKQATAWIDDHRQDVKDFFAQAVQTSGEIAKLAGTIAKALFGLFDSGQVDKFANSIQKAVPALTAMASAVGDVAQVFVAIAGTGPGSILLQFALVAGGLSKLLTPLIGLFIRFGIDIARIFGSEGVVDVLGVALRFFKPVTTAVILLYAAVEILNGKLTNLHDIIHDLAGVLAGFLAFFYGRQALTAGVKLLSTELEGLGAQSLLSKLGPLGNFFGSMLTNVKDLITRIPILGKLISKTKEPSLPSRLSPAGGRPGVTLGAGTRRVVTTEEAQAAERGAASGVTSAAEATTATAAATKLGVTGGAEGLLSKAGPIIAGIVAIADLVTSKGNIIQRAQSVLSDFSFGIIPKPDLGQKGASAAATRNLGGGVFRATTQGADVFSTVAVPANIPTAGSSTGTPATTAVIRHAGPTVSLDDIQRAIDNAAKNGIGKLSPNDSLLLQQILGVSNLDKITNWDTIKKNFDNLKPSIQQAVDALKGFKSSIKDIDISQVADPNAVAQFLSNLQRLKTVGSTSIGDFRKNFEFNLDEINKGFESGTEGWRRAIEQNFGAGIDAIKKGMKDGDISTKDGMSEISKIVKQQMQFVRDNMDQLSADGKDRIASNFAAARGAIETQSGGWVKATGKALKQIHSLMKEELKVFGLSEDQAANIAKGGAGGGQFGDPNNNLGREGGASLAGAGAATGGFVGNQGERGPDLYHRVLGRGEAVLNHAHQRYVQPAMNAMYGFGLGDLFKKVRGQHAAGDGMASGGFVAEPGTNFSYGDEPKIVSDLRQLAQILRTTIFGISGYRSPQHSVAVGGFADDPHTRGEAADVGVGSPTLASAGRLTAALLRRVGLWRPYYPADPHEINHVELISGSSGARGAGTTSQSIAASVAQGIKRVLVEGPNGGGIFGGYAQASVDAVRTAYNSILGASGASTSDNSKIPAFTGAWTKVMARIASSLHWNLDDWRWIVGHESSGRVSAKNPTSTAFGLGQLLDSTYAKYGGGPGSSGSEQIRAMAAYIKDRYLNPTRAKEFWQAHNWYAKGGEIFGKLGQAVPIVAHAGEWVVNQMQQSKLAGMIGTTVSGVRGALGFSGGPSSFAGGGSVQPYVEPVFVGSSPGDILNQVASANALADKLKTSIINAKFTDALSRTIAAIAGDGGLLDQLSDAVQAYTDKLSTALSRATYSINKQGQVIKSLSDSEIAKRTDQNLTLVYLALYNEHRDIADQLRDTADRLKKSGLSSGERDSLLAVQVNLQKRLGDVDSAIAQNLSDRYQAVEDAVQAEVDAAQTKSTAATTSAGIQQRLRSVLGAGGADALGIPEANALGFIQAQAFNSQAADLQKAADYAKAQGHTDTYTNLVDQILDLRTQAIEAVQQGLQQAESDIESTASAAQARTDVKGRLADLLEKAGDVVGAYALRGQNLQETGQTLTTERDSLLTLAGQAQAAGQTGVYQDLIDKVGDLNEQIAENTEAVKENTTAAEQATVDATNARQTFLGGVTSGLLGIITGLGTQSGVTNTTEQRSILQGAGQTLQGTGTDLKGQLSSDFGIDLSGLDPLGIVDFFKNFDFTSFEANLNPTQRSLFEGLVNSIISNTSAQIDNTNQIAALDGSLSQTFSSPEWQNFRTAVFNGANGLLSGFSMTVPSAAIGARVMSDGLVYAHSGEKIQPASVSSYEGGDNITLQVTTPTEVLDPGDIGRQLAFYRKTQG